LGYWGYYPADSDDAWDLKDKVDEAINNKLSEMFSQKLYEEKNVPDFLMKKEIKRRKQEELFTMWHRIGVVQLLLQTGTAVSVSCLAMCVHYFGILDEDYKKFSKGWRDAIAFERVFKKTKGEFEKLVKDSDGKDVVIAPRGWLKRPWEKSGASWTGIIEAVEKDLQQEEEAG
jgi:hypothetical protein